MNDQNEKFKILNDRIEDQQEMIIALSMLIGVMLLFNVFFWILYLLQ